MFVSLKSTSLLSSQRSCIQTSKHGGSDQIVIHKEKSPVFNQIIQTQMILYKHTFGLPAHSVDNIWTSFSSNTRHSRGAFFFFLHPFLVILDINHQRGNRHVAQDDKHSMLICVSARNTRG